jgi:hypothetical protein
MSLDGALFDEGKLNYFCKEVLAATPKEELLKAVKEWAEKHLDLEMIARKGGLS